MTIDNSTPSPPAGAVAAALECEPDAMSAIARRRRLRELAASPHDQLRPHSHNDTDEIEATGDVASRAAVATRRLHQLTRRRSQSRER